MMSSWNISWPNNGSTLRLLRPQAARDSAGASDTAQGMLDICATTSRVEGHFPAPGEFQNWGAGVQDVQQDLEETAETESTQTTTTDVVQLEHLRAIQRELAQASRAPGSTRRCQCC